MGIVKIPLHGLKIKGQFIGGDLALLGDKADMAFGIGDTVDLIVAYFIAEQVGLRVLDDDIALGRHDVAVKGIFDHIAV